MPALPIQEIAALLEETLEVWRLDGIVEMEEGGLLVSAGDRSLRIAAAPDGAPFRWLVQTAEKSRGAGSIAALLRSVRNVLDPDHAGSRLRLAPHGIVPP